MDLIGIKVVSPTYGEGTIVSQTVNRVDIQFGVDKRTFAYPTSFKLGLKAIDASIQEKILGEIREIEERQRQLEAQQEAQREEARKARAQAQSQVKVEPKKTAAPVKTVKNRNVYTHTARLSGKPMYFYVFQGDTFEQESAGGYIWAPKVNKDGMSMHHWERLMDIRKGDLVFHGWNGQINAVSIALSPFEEGNRPNTFNTVNQWDKYGRAVKLDYQAPCPLTNPVPTKTYKQEIMRICRNMKYSPFDKDGNGNMGYLYELPKELAKIFAQGVIAANPSLAQVPQIHDLISI